MTDVKFSDFTDGNQCQIGDIVVGLRSGDNYRFDFPSNGIKDSNGNFLYQWATVGASAVNYLILENSAAGNGASIKTEGDDASIDIDLVPKGSGVVNVPNPTTPTSATTKAYVDALVSGDSFAKGARVATTGNFASTYDNGTAGVGATLTASSNGAASIDGVALSVNDRVLFKDQTNTFENGIYILSTNGTGGTPSIFTRWVSFDEPSEMNFAELVGIVEGNTNYQSIWQLTSTVSTIGTDAVNFQIQVVQTPTSSTDEALVRWNGTDAKVVQNSNATLTDAGTLSLSANLHTNNISFDGGSNVVDTDGQLIIGNTGSNPSIATLTAGTGITINNGSGSIEIVGSGAGGFTWNEVTGTSDNLVSANGYIANNASLVTLTLPATASIGDTFIIQGKGAGLFRIAQNASQTIHFGGSDTTTGAGGYIEATAQYDSVEIVCITANTDFAVLTGVQGIFTVV